MTYRKGRIEMIKQSKTQEVQERILELVAKKTSELDTVKQKEQEAHKQLEEAEQAIKEAAAIMNDKKYAEATAYRDKVRIIIQMYADKFEQINKQEYISEEESDKVIGSLLAYEEELTESFKNDLLEPLKIIYNLIKEYKAEIDNTEQTINKWTSEIHANYNTRGRSQYYDKLTGKYTSRCSYPVPVRNNPYYGCSEALQLEEFFKKNYPLLPL